MLCYKDMTFCSFYKTCKEGSKCGRALTGQIERGAERLGYYISQFVDKPDCYKEIKK